MTEEMQTYRCIGCGNPYVDYAGMSNDYCLRCDGAVVFEVTSDPVAGYGSVEEPLR